MRTNAWRAIDAEELWIVRGDDGRAAAREWDAQEIASGEGGLVVEEHRHHVRQACLVVHEAAQRRPDLVEHRLVVVGEEERALLLGLWDEAPEADAIARGEVIELGRGDGLALLVDVSGGPVHHFNCRSVKSATAGVCLTVAFIK